MSQGPAISHPASVLEGFSEGLRERVIYVRSEDIKSNQDETNNELTIRLAETVTAGPLEIINCTVTDAVIPFSFYMLSSELKNNVVAFSYTGYQAQEADVASIAYDGPTATASATAHGFDSGATVTIAGASPTLYNGTYVISNVSTNAFDYTLSETPEESGTGSDITARGLSDTTTTTSGSITFEPENYSVYSFMADIKTALNAFLSDNAFMAGDGTASATGISYSRTKNKLTFSLQTETSATDPLLPRGAFTFKLAAGGASAQNMYPLFGFPPDDTTFIFGNDALSTDSPITSPYAINLNTVAQILLKGSFSNRSMLNIENQSSETSTILSVLPITVSPFQFMNLSGATNRPIIRIPSKKLSVFTLSLQTEGGLPLNLNGIGWMCVLQFTIQKRSSLTTATDFSERLKALGIRQDARVIPSYVRERLAARTKQPNLAEVQERATRKRRREPKKKEPKKKEPVTPAATAAT